VCGIAGFIKPAGALRVEELRVAASNMADQLASRGPDSAGIWTDPSIQIGLAHRRLAILDVSDQGHQPMQSTDGRYVIVFNGEIYNFQHLRADLHKAGCRFRGESDTEVLLAAVSTWELEPALLRLNGMFAFALWDRGQRRLHLVRDRLGEKPVYYGWCGRHFLFGSELKALRVHSAFEQEIDQRSLQLYFQYDYIPTPHSIYKGIHKLPPGHHVTINPLHVGELPNPKPYWSAARAFVDGAAHPFAGTEEEAANELELLLLDSVKLRLQSDVPLGAFLSGGVDSSLVVALMQKLSSTPVRTFSIGVAEQKWDEAGYAKRVAAHLGTKHTEWYVTPRDCQNVIPELPAIYDEPFADASQIPTLLVSRLARRSVTVSLSGDGGDELFGGYNRYFWGQSANRWFRPIPCACRRFAAGLLRGLSPSWSQILVNGVHAIPGLSRPHDPTAALGRIADLLTCHSTSDLHCALVHRWQNPETLVIGSEPVPSPVHDSRLDEIADIARRLMYLDTISYLPDDILVKLDRASMAVSLESRVPLLDHRVVEFACSLPLAISNGGIRRKHLLRKVLYRHVPSTLIDRPKMGFMLPIRSWLRGPLREWAEDLLSVDRLTADGLLYPPIVRDTWEQHIRGRRNLEHHLWSILMFQAWLGSVKPPCSSRLSELVSA
jgi:asparagine synthase (glutamine-hydrolysing)